MDIQTEDEHQSALARCSVLVDIDPERGAPEGDEIEALSIAIERYGDEHYPMRESVEDMELAKIVCDRADEPPVPVDIKSL
ncbi:hypothetical protein [Paraburkholderia solisilvae]|uniref:Uncharacterized protein n=1 Tax=Paraburkholderia solisilvae TaxID=624376 RepID=A0A6J5EWS8_9BURK|nr:hypothetical protein [Paraburkholderia solisilvae]CAB3770474.1 hypothetical protein LMG29739_05793 [Paraburkholderia solisilvae]